MYEITKKYSKVKGFNIQPDWASNGCGIWLGFDAERYRKLIKIGKERFPSMNTVRVWLSFDAYMQNRALYLKNVRIAADILTEEGLNIVPVYLNGWFGIPQFGGFTAECIQENQIPPYRFYIRETAKALQDANVIINDISNEPFNNVYGNQGIFEVVYNFLNEMVKELRSVDNRPITIGTQSYVTENKKMCDIDRLAPIVDVITLHPYNINKLSLEEHEKTIEKLLDYITPFNKPVIITECCWSAPSAEERIPYLETELITIKKYNIGFLAHALFTSPVADLNPIESIHRKDGLYMAFCDESFNIRPHHDIFNKLFLND